MEHSITQWVTCTARRKFTRALMTVALAAGVAVVATPGQASAGTLATLGFDKVFAPATVGPGSTSTLTFTIDNSDNASLTTDIAFTDNLPAGMSLATPPRASTTCTDGVVTLGPASISLSGARLAAFSTCTVTVDVVGTATGLNTSGPLTYSGGGETVGASATLTVDTALPGFSKSFSPGSVPVDHVSTLTFLIDNTANASGLFRLRFVDNLPADLVVAAPANATTDCGDGVAATVVTLDAAPGGASIQLIADKFTTGTPLLAAGATCTVRVDVMPRSNGSFANASEQLEVGYAPFGSLTPTGFATAQLDAPVEFLVKTYTDDPVPPGGTVTLRFTITNLDRTSDATDIAFDDPLDASLTGLAPNEALPKAACGGTVDFTAGVLSLSGASLAPGASCEFTVTLAVPGGAVAGSYTNTTDPITATVGGPVVGNSATDDLVVSSAPSFTKEFIDDPSGAGGPTTLRFTITNNDPDFSFTDIAFTDDLNTAVPGLAADSLVVPGGGGGDPAPLTDVCGTGSELTVSDPAPSFIPPDATMLIFTGGSLATGASCSFDVVLTVPVGTPGGVYTNTTGPLTGDIDGATVTVPPAGGDLEVIGAPRLVKEFTDDPAQPGGTATLEFTINHDEFAPGAATGITFTDDVAAALAGLAATGLPVADVCGAGSQISGTTELTLTGGTLAAGESCTFSVTLDVPGAANAGSYPNVTSDISATVDGVGVVGNPATDDLRIAGVTLTKEFTDDPVRPGGTGTLRFTLANIHPDDDATGISFTDDLDAALDGLAAEAPLPDTSSCGGSSSLSGTTFLVFSGGALAAGTSCSFDVTVRVPDAAPEGDHINTTSSVTATMDGSFFVGDLATDALTVANPLPPLLTKSFTDDPVAAGDPVTLQFEITNPNDGDALTSIGFTDDLAPVLGGLVATGPTDPDPPCGASSSVVLSSGDTLITFAGGELAPNASCTFSLILSVPASAGGGSYPNTTSPITADYDVCVLPCVSPMLTGIAASDSLVVSGLTPTFSKTFTDDPVVPGAPVTLEFTIDNSASTTDAVDLGFTDDLGAVVSGLVATNPSVPNVCGAGSLLSGTSFLTLTGGNVAAGATCTFQVELAVPPAAPEGSFPNATSELFAGGVAVADAATDDLVVEFPDISVTKDDGVTAAVPGQDTVTYTIVVTNNGGATVTGVDVDDTFPTELTCTYSSVPAGGATGNDDSGTLAIDNTLSMPAGSSVTYTVGCSIDASATGTLSNTVTAIPPIMDVSPADNTATDDDTVLTPEADLTITKTDSDDPVVAGEGLTYTVTVDNAGPSDAANVVVTDTLPAGVTLVSTTGCAEDPVGAPTCSLGTIAAGSSGSYTIEVAVDPDVADGSILTNTATVTADTTLINTGDDSIDETTEVATEADLTITKTDSADPVVAGDPLTYTVTVTNAGPSDAANVVVTDTLPTGVTIVATNGCTEDPGGIPTCSLGTIAAGSSDSYTIEVAVDPDVADGSILTNTATVTADTTLINTGDDSIDETTEVATEADLTITKTDSADPVLAGDPLTYTVTVTNAGPSDAANVVVTDTLPAGVTVVSTAGCAEDPAGVPTCSLGTIAAGGSASFTIAVIVASGVADGTVLTNTASVTADTTLINTGDDIVDETTNVGVAADLVITKADSVDPVLAGDDLTYTVNVRNVGPSDATDVVVTDTLPVGVTLVSTTGCAEDPSGAPTCSLGTIPRGGGGSYTITVSVDSGLADATVLTNTASVTAGTTLVNTVDDTVDETTEVLTIVPPTFDKAFAPATILAGTVSTLTFTIDNSANRRVTSALDFTDVLPAGVAIATPSGVGTTCTGGTLAAPDGGGTVAYTGGSVAAGASCTISVDVTAPADGVFVNTTGDLTSSSGNSGPATATLTVDPRIAPSFGKVFAPATILAGTVSTLTFTIDNSASTLAADGLDFTDVLPAGVVIATPSGVGTTCTGGTLAAPDGGGTVAYTGGSVAAGASCTISVNVVGSAAGAHVNTTGDLTSSSGNSGPATATLTVTPRTPPTVTIDQATGQADPTNEVPVVFTVVFSETVTGFGAAGVSVTNGSVGSVTGSGATYTVSVDPSADGDVTATVVAGAAVDGEGTANVASTSTDNVVHVDTVDPVINTPGDISVPAGTGLAGANVEFVVTTDDEGVETGLRVSSFLRAVPLADSVVAPGGLVCTPASGSFFPIGTTTVTCNAVDLAGNTATASFEVEVVDTQNPIVINPGTITATVAGSSGPVNYTPPTATDNSGEVTVTCVPPPGAIFVVGTTAVTCTATDGSGNTATVTFSLVVTSPRLPATGGGLGGIPVGLLMLLAGVGFLTVSRIGRRRRAVPG